jgi:hypothetical protein
MKLLISVIVAGLVGAAPMAQAACLHHDASCHKHYAHRYYRHYAEAGVVVPPPPPPASFDQPLEPAFSIGDPDWRDRNTLKLLMDNIGDIPYNR